MRMGQWSGDGMTNTPKRTATAIVNVTALPDKKNAFVAWQEKTNSVASGFPGFVSAQLVAPNGQYESDYVNIFRFSSPEFLRAWMDCPEHAELVAEGAELMADSESTNIVIGEDNAPREPVTAVITSRVTPEAEGFYREWNDRMCRVIAKQRGSLGTQVQEPIPGYQDQWVIMARFDSEENLHRWLSSKSRTKLLVEIKPYLVSETVKRARTSFDGWFPFKDGHEPPRSWQQSAIVLLVLFPVVALEILFITPYLAWLKFAPATFIGNVISVAVTGFVLIPIAARAFSWWIKPNISKKRLWVGILIIIVLYVVAMIAIDWVQTNTPQVQKWYGFIS